MSKHKIGWLNIPGYKGETWNPVVGCSKVSAGCENCYAEAMAKRLKSMGLPQYQDVVDDNGWTGVVAEVQGTLRKPLHWKKPRAIFVCSMGDLFHESVSESAIDWVYTTMAQAYQHIFIVLTKRPQRAVKWYRKRGFTVEYYEPFPNVWLGVTAENQETANKRIPDLLKVPAAVRFVSVEPMLGAVDLLSIPYNSLGALHKMNALNGYGGWGDYDRNKYKLDWVICGGESGPHARPMNPDWARDLRDQCKAAGVPFFMKQMSGRTPAERQDIPPDLMIRQFPKILEEK